MSLSREAVLHVAELASLSLAESEIEGLARDLDAIVRYVEQLNEVDTEGVEPVTSVGRGGALRPDVVQPCLSREEALAEAPHATEEGFAVPRFVES